MAYRRRVYRKRPVRRYKRKVYGRGAYGDWPEIDLSGAYKSKGNSYISKMPVSTGGKGRTGLGNTMQAVGTVLGSLLGNYGFPGIGGALGGVGGSIAGSVLSKITGQGAYKRPVKANSLYLPTGSGVLHMAKAGGSENGNVRIRHREYVQDIISASVAGAFKSEAIRIYPSNSAIFKWLGPVANQFDQYQIHGISFEYKTTSGDVLTSTNSAMGTVILAPQYNTSDPLFTNKRDMVNYESAISSIPSQSMILFMECERSQTPFKILYTYRPTIHTQDLRLNVFANIAMGSSGFQGTSINAGELWVSYDIELMKPRMGSAAALLGDHYEFTTGVSTSAYFGTSNLLLKQTSSNLGTTLTGTTIVFDGFFSGAVVVHYTMFGDSTAWVQPTTTGTLGATSLNILQQDVNNTLAVNAVSTVGQMTEYFNIIPANDGTFPTITFSAGTVILNSQKGDLIISTISLFN